MDLAALVAFVESAQRGSFAAVARDRGQDPSAVSRVVAGLEAELGVRLLQRTTRRMALTEAGEAYLARVAPLVEELGRARDEVASLRAGPSGIGSVKGIPSSMISAPACGRSRTTASSVSGSGSPAIT